MKILKNRWAKAAIAVFALFILLILFRVPLMRSIGSYLIDDTEAVQCDMIFVLGGNSYDRGKEAAKLYENELTESLVCTGGNVPNVLEALDTLLYEAEITKQLLINWGVNQEHIDALTSSTSTQEESEEILEYCIKSSVKRIGILSSKFHLRRTRNVFENTFANEEVELYFFGAPSSVYSEEEWWKSEEGMIMVNNEYMKLLYYFIKH